MKAGLILILRLSRAAEEKAALETKIRAEELERFQGVLDSLKKDQAAKESYLKCGERAFVPLTVSAWPSCVLSCFPAQLNSRQRTEARRLVGGGMDSNAARQPPQGNRRQGA